VPHAGQVRRDVHHYETRTMTTADGEGDAGRPEGQDQPRFDWKWGLMPETADGSPPAWRQALHHWFVRYNPLYCFSALCVLAGVFLVARGAGRLEAHWVFEVPVFLFAVIQAYEALLILGCAFLARRVGAIRPAVLLALAEVVFLFDCTFRLESIAHVGPAAPWLIGLWVVLVAGKLRGLAWALRLSIPVTAYGLTIAAAAGIAATVAGLSAPALDKTMTVQLAGWYGALLFALALGRRPAIACAFAVTPWGCEVLRRAGRAALIVLTLLYVYHLWSFILFVSGERVGAMVFGQAGALLLVGALRARNEPGIFWFGCAVVLTALPGAAAASIAAFVVAGVFAYHAAREELRRLAVGAALALYAGVWLIGWQGGALPALPAIVSWQSAGLVAVLIVIGWRLRVQLAWVALGLLALPAVYSYAPRFLPRTELGWGLLLLALGFVALLAGLAVNWWLRSVGPSPPNPPEGVTAFGKP
jgi:hypothetical protein